MAWEHEFALEEVLDLLAKRFEQALASRIKKRTGENATSVFSYVYQTAIND